MTRVVAAFSSTRADLWPLAPVLDALAGDPRTTPVLIATGGHLADAYGAVGWEGGARLDIERIDAGLGSDDSPGALLQVASREAVGVGDVLLRRSPDLLIVLGDRYELLGVMLAALLHRVPVVHLHGGDVTEGAFDDAVRHAVTKLASLHCCATDLAAARVRSMGEEAWRIHVTGAPALDTLLDRVAEVSVEQWQAAIGGPPVRPFGIMTYHPPTASPGDTAGELEALLAACDRLGTVVVTSPGAEPGSRAIIERVEAWGRERRDVRIVPSLGACYAPALAAADLVLGNSSSGIVEAPTLGVPAVNVGDRQRGRERPIGVLDVPGRADAIRAAIDRALEPEFRTALATAANPYGDGHASTRIVDLVASVPLTELLRKRFVDEEDR